MALYMFTLVKNANVYAPEALGIKDILIAAGKILQIENTIDSSNMTDINILDAKGKTLIPGFVDGHVHLIGGGGEGGYHTRTPEVRLSHLTLSGITTVVGLLGTDCSTRHNDSLYAKAKALTTEGVSAYMFTGGYKVPSETITQSIQRDIVFIDRVIGLKTAVSDHRSSQPQTEELSRMASEARVAGLISGKCGRVVAHLGNSTTGFEPLLNVIKHSDIPISQFIPTHVNRTELLADQGMDWLKLGGYVDLTAGINPDKGARGSVKASTFLARCKSNKIDTSKVCISSDGNGSVPVFNEKRELIGLKVAGFGSLLYQLKEMIQVEKMSISEAIIPFTQAPAQCLGLASNKGEIALGKDADFLILDDNLDLRHTFAKGVCHVKDGIAQIKGTFED
ncbi:beta-aspartyl-peptidase [Marinomonas posidonica]|uniref:Isoaspartyl dipeptidase n=1 Tax=Marinomonas posidonica (strain CECT 7376 / NCIMB 14433 / IVIA-Po-181) TaxID=491952 RepID=F6CT54_MARPP|nr:beta-aspartyl-peptidase [Marinomonas posidonica]AEF56220.1 isoaspartyl dipeptidase [Marinomonas posidonica IVIA-Po-181]